MFIRSLMLGPFGVNCYIVACEETKECVIIDPGFDVKRIIAELKIEGLTLKAIINTHCHIDHVGAVQDLRKATGVPFLIHKDEEPLLKTLGHQAMMFGLAPFTVEKPDGYLKEGDIVSFGKEKLTVLETPGHSPGSISFYSDEIVFVGDVLFAGSIGRTDLIGGSLDTLIASIFNKLIPLGENTVVYSGHGPETTIGNEKRSNPFLNGTY